MLLPIASAWAVGVGVIPSDGVSPTGPARPAWVALATQVPVRGDLAALSAELDLAWAERRRLENDAAGRRVDGLIAALRPTLDAGGRDLLQRALFARGVFDIDEVGAIDALPNPVLVGGVPIPKAWAEAIAVSPGAPAPATADAAFAVNVYDEARTALAQQGGPSFDPSCTACGDVRVDGLPAAANVTLLPGTHTLSWHPVGGDPWVLTLVPETLRDIESFGRRVADNPRAADRDRLRRTLGSRAYLVGTDSIDKLVWLVDGAARTGPPEFGVGLSVGGSAFLGGGLSVACDGTLDEPTKGVVSGAVDAAAALGPVRFRAGAGILRTLGSGFAVASELDCDIEPAAEMVETMAWGWMGAGRRFRLAGDRELEPFVRVGATPVYALVQAGAVLRIVPRPVVEVRLAAGPAANVWSGEDGRVAFLGGLETAVHFPLSRSALPGGGPK